MRLACKPQSCCWPRGTQACRLSYGAGGKVSAAAALIRGYAKSIVGLGHLAAVDWGLCFQGRDGLGVPGASKRFGSGTRPKCSNGKRVGMPFSS
jgi:hypothetical protein